jgi:hypothetical protein
MKQIVYFLTGFFISFLVLIQFAHADDYGSTTEGLQGWVDHFATNCSPVTDGRYRMHFLGFYTSPNEAYLACWYACDADYNAYDYPNSASQAFRMDAQAEVNSLTDSVWEVRGYMTGFHDDGFDVYYAMGFDGGTPPGGTVDPPTSDSDDDGIPDEYDLYPNDSEPYQYAIKNILRDADTGEIKAIYLKTDRGDFFMIGDSSYCDTNDCDQEMTLTDNWRSGDTLQDYGVAIAEETLPANAEEIDTFFDQTIANNSTVTQNAAENITQGAESTGTETDNEALRAIQDNTAKATENQQVLADLLHNINENISTMNSREHAESATDTPIVVTIEGGDETETTPEDLSGTAAGMNSESAGFDSNLSQATGDLQTAYETDSTLDDLPTHPEDEFLGIATDKFDLSQRLMDMITANPVTQALTGIDIQTSGSCSFSWDYKGNTIEFSVCNFQTALNAFGQILLGLTSIYSILVLFGYRKV